MENLESAKLTPQNLDAVVGGISNTEEVSTRVCDYCRKEYSGDAWFNERGFCSSDCWTRYDLQVNKI